MSDAGYSVPAGSGESEYIEKRSRFIGYIRPVESEEEAKSFIASIKKKHYDARHNCWCYIIHNGPERYSDDGEPQGTAGIPMLEMLRHEGVSNVVCVVTRYFGGILLGTGGLLRAYTKAAKDALYAAGIAAVRSWTALRFNAPYALLERLKLEIAAYEGSVSGIDYGSDVSFSIMVPAEKAVPFCQRITDAFSGTVVVEPDEPGAL